jgi:hypothetical protein
MVTGMRREVERVELLSGAGVINAYKTIKKSGDSCWVMKLRRLWANDVEPSIF